MFSTIAAAAGAAPPSDRAIDGVDLLPFASGENPGEPHESLFWRSGHYATVMAGGWKLQSSKRPDKRWLYKLDQDPTERNNLAQLRPEKTAELVALLDRYSAEVGPPAWPAIVEGAISVDRPLNTEPVPGEEYIYWPN